ncbi:4Fe-4S binding protein [Caldanaerobacter subterraneus]|uniref:4Fe-4S binding protein n=1 Tax=Caldanaerobacter subterraneus TaxID=911092 RepID=UPI001A9F7260
MWKPGHSLSLTPKSKAAHIEKSGFDRVNFIKISILYQFFIIPYLYSDIVEIKYKGEIRMHKKKIHIRTLIQIFFFILILLISINKTLSEKGISIPYIPTASLHALCPFGGVVTIYQYLTTGTFIQKIHESSFVLMIIGFIIAILFGPLFCGWICPFGTFQEFIGKLGKKIFKKRFNNFVPYKYDKYLRYLRYFVFAWVLYATIVAGKLIFQDVDPYYALFNFWNGEIAVGSIVILFITIILSLFIERPWCKYLCPYGAVLGIFNLIRIFPIKRNNKTCINCKMCDRNCPMNIKVSEKTIIRDHQCISCLKCTSEYSCPINNTVTIESIIPYKS